MVSLGSITIIPSMESWAFQKPLSTLETIPTSPPPTTARPMTQKLVTQIVTPVKTGKNPKLPSSRDSAGLKRKRGA